MLGITLFMASCGYNQEPTPDNEQLATYTFNIPDALQALAADGQVQSHTCNKKHNSLDATFTLNAETIQLDSGVAIIKSVEVILARGSEGTTFTAEIHNNQEKARGLRDLARRNATVIITSKQVLNGSSSQLTQQYSITPAGTCIVVF